MDNCPNTRMVLGGYSQGAGVIDIIAAVPFPAVGFNAPLPPNAPDHVAAIAVFGNPTAKVGLPMTSSPVWGSRAIDLCNGGDPVCGPGEDVGGLGAGGDLAVGGHAPRLHGWPDQPGRQLRRRASLGSTKVTDFRSSRQECSERSAC